jgi:hypothetical protein
MIDYEWIVTYCEYTFKSGDPSTAILSVLHWTCNGTDTTTLNYAGNIGTEDVTPEDVQKPSATVDQTDQPELLTILFNALGAEKAAIEQRVKNAIDLENNPTGGGFIPPSAP